MGISQNGALRYEIPSTQQGDINQLASTNRDRLFVEWVGRDRRVLEMGCSTGFLSRILRENGCSVTGLEYDPEMAKAAEHFCERVFCADLNKREWRNWLSDKFDVISFGDVLEHLIDPQQALEDCRDLLSSDGRIIVSVPNVAFLSNRLRLLRGNWDYTDTGLLDRTHLRFFTLKSTWQMCEAAGFRVVRYLPISGLRGDVRFPKLCQAITNRFPNLFGFQHLLELSR